MPFLAFVALFTVSLSSLVASEVYPGKNWDFIEEPESVGFSNVMLNEESLVKFNHVEPAPPAGFSVSATQRDTVSWAHRECQILDKNHEIWSESGRRGSVWCHIRPESIPQGLGSLWDASRTLKPTKNQKFRFSGF